MGAMKDLVLGGELNSKCTDAGLLLLRLFTGLALALAHGWGKVPPEADFVGRIEQMGMPAPLVFAWLAAVAEVGGGLLIAVGLLTRPASLLVLGHFVIVVLLAHAGDPFEDRELALFFGVAALVFLIAGAGRYSVDAVLRARAS